MRPASTGVPLQAISYFGRVRVSLDSIPRVSWAFEVPICRGFLSCTLLGLHRI